jgi:hypothetical protein
LVKELALEGDVLLADEASRGDENEAADLIGKVGREVSGNCSSERVADDGE